MKPIVGSRCVNISFCKLFICHFCYKPYFYTRARIFSIFIWFQTTIYTFIQLLFVWFGYLTCPRSSSKTLFMAEFKINFHLICIILCILRCLFQQTEKMWVCTSNINDFQYPSFRRTSISTNTFFVGIVTGTD